MAESEAATRNFVAICTIILIVIIGIAGVVFWIPTKEAVERIESLQQPCVQGEQR